MSEKLNIQNVIFKLEQLWASKGCMIMPLYDEQKGAGAMSPYTPLRAAGLESWAACYVELSERPADGRYSDNPNRLYQHHQFQVVIKPVPKDIQQYHLNSLGALGIEPPEYDIRFVEDNWANPSMGCAGVGWEVWLDRMEVSQFIYFQVVGELDVKPAMSEITYGVERLASYIQDVNSAFDLEWGDGARYRDIFKQPEYEHSKYVFEENDQKQLLKFFDIHEATAKRLLSQSLVHPAYDYILKCSHTSNSLDARGAVSVTERIGYLLRIRNLAHLAAKGFVEEREKYSFLLLRHQEETRKAGRNND